MYFLKLFFILICFLVPSTSHAVVQILWAGEGQNGDCSELSPCSLSTALSTVADGDNDIIYVYGPGAGYGSGSFSAFTLSGASHVNLTVSATPAVISSLTYTRGVVQTGNGNDRPLFTGTVYLSAAGVTIQHLRLRRASSPDETQLNVVEVNNTTSARDTTIDHCEIYNGGQGVWHDIKRWVTISNNYFHTFGTGGGIDNHAIRIFAYGTEPTTWSQGIKIYHNTGNDIDADFIQLGSSAYGDLTEDRYVDIWDNDVSDCGEQFFDSKGSNYIKIRGNIITGNNYYVAVWANSGENFDPSTDYFIYNNTFYANSSAVVGCESYNCSTWYVWNNIFYNNSKSPPFNDFCVIFQLSSDSRINHNVFWDNGLASGPRSGGICNLAGSPQIQNNIFYENVNQGGLDSNYSANTNWFDTNDPGARGSNAITGSDPFFNNINTAPYDFHLTALSTDLIDAGLDLSGDATSDYTINIDKDGILRDSTPWLGAYDTDGGSAEPVITIRSVKIQSGN